MVLGSYTFGVQYRDFVAVLTFASGGFTDRFLSPKVDGCAKVDGYAKVDICQLLVTKFSKYLTSGLSVQLLVSSF